ncbi:MAG: hypothetical protein AABW89_02075 [Nanoarchaeota archaeon]
MAKPLRGFNSVLLKIILLISLFVFDVLAYVLITGPQPMLSPSGASDYWLGGMIVWGFTMGMVLALLIVFFILYFFIRET